MKYIWDKSQNTFIPAAEFYARRAVSHGPMVISDQLADVWNPIDGKHYDSKSNYYRTVRRAGCEITGNEPVKDRARPEFIPQGIGQDIKKSIEQLRSR